MGVLFVRLFCTDSWLVNPVIYMTPHSRCSTVVCRSIENEKRIVTLWRCGAAWLLLLFCCSCLDAITSMKEIHGSSPWGAGKCIFFSFAPPRHFFLIFSPSCRVVLTCFAFLITTNTFATIFCIFNYNPGTFSDVDGHRQPSQVELDIAKHQATCVACTVVRA